MYPIKILALIFGPALKKLLWDSSIVGKYLIDKLRFENEIKYY
jgi:hypothetical protein